MKRRDSLSGTAWAVVLAVGVAVACGSESTTAPAGPAALGKGGPGSGGQTSISVSGADPDTIPVDTTLAVRILGSGFAPGATVEYALAGVVSTKVTAPQVTFVSSKELLTSTNVAADAPLGGYDIVVTSGGKRGTCVEKVQVVARAVYLPEADGVRSAAEDVNDDGVIVGWVYDALDQEWAVRWTPRGEGWEAATLGPGAAAAINRTGTIIRRVLDDNLRLFTTWVVTSTGVEISLGTGSYAVDIADDGTITGFLKNADGVSRLGVWPQTGPATWGSFLLLPELAGYQGAGTTAISANGNWIAGYAGRANMEWAMLWRRQGGTWMEPVLVDADLGGAAIAVNDQGAVAGAVWPCTDGSCASQPAYWQAAGAPRVPLYTEGWGRVMRMNNAHQMVGTSRIRTGKGPGTLQAVPALWAPAATPPLNLGKPRATDQPEARSINNGHLAVGKVSAKDGKWHAVVWILP